LGGVTQTAPTALVPEWTLGDRLRKAREFAGLHATQLADEIGIGRNSVSNYENGHTKPRRPVLQAWAMRTGVDYEWLVTGQATRPSVPAGEGAERAAAITFQAPDTPKGNSRTSARYAPLGAAA